MATAGWALAAVAWLGFVNLWAWLAFRGDKKSAALGRRRTPEGTLLTLAFLGGWFGAKHAQRHFRHKTRKEPFRTRLNLVPFAWAAALGLLALVRSGLVDL